MSRRSWAWITPTRGDLTAPGERLIVHIDSEHDQHVVFDATLSLSPARADARDACAGSWSATPC